VYSQPAPFYMNLFCITLCIFSFEFWATLERLKFQFDKQAVNENSSTNLVSLFIFFRSYSSTLHSSFTRTRRGKIKTFPPSSGVFLFIQLPNLLHEFPRSLIQIYDRPKCNQQHEVSESAANKRNRTFGVDLLTWLTGNLPGIMCNRSRGSHVSCHKKCKKNAELLTAIKQRYRLQVG